MQVTTPHALTIRLSTREVLTANGPRFAVVAKRGDEMRAVAISEHGLHVAQATCDAMSRDAARHGDYLDQFAAAPRVEHGRSGSGKKWLKVVAA